MSTIADEQPASRPIPRSWREEFDGLKPIRPIAYRKPAAMEPRRRSRPSAIRGRDEPAEN
jgi:hypothetical protein